MLTAPPLLFRNSCPPMLMTRRVAPRRHAKADRTAFHLYAADDKVAEFDRLAERAAEGVRMTEPDTLVYVIHVVPKAPMQRIVYEIYRNRAAFESHERQPHIQRFMADRASCVLATNIIDLRLKYAKVTALGARPGRRSARPRRPSRRRPRSPSPGPQGRPPEATSPALASTRAASTSNGSQYSNGGNGSQYGNGTVQRRRPVQRRPVQRPVRRQQATVARTQYQAPAASPSEAPAAASFTPAGEDRYAAAASQYAAPRPASTPRPGSTATQAAGKAGPTAASTRRPPNTLLPADIPSRRATRAPPYQATASYQATAPTAATPQARGTRAGPAIPAGRAPVG